MLTANDARNLVPGLPEKLEAYTSKIDLDIMMEAKHGGRSVKNCYGGKGYNDQLAEHYRDNGFEVHHYTAPFDELEIIW